MFVSSTEKKFTDIFLKDKQGMDKQQAQNIVKETFENPFDKGRFVAFIRNLLNSIEEAPFTYKGNLIRDAYEQYISSLERIGKYTDGEHKIDILVVKLKKKTSIERARTMQRNFIAWYLNGSRGGELKDAALTAFVSPNEEDWRFSLIKMDYRFEEGKKGRVKVEEEFTPARRWSFLVGKNEKSHTAQIRLVPIIADDRHNPTLSELEEAFNIEKVTKEFFEKYRDLFLRTKETLDEVVAANPNVKADFESKGVNTIDFAKKLLGQIVFLYFLQKKGWFGVARDAGWGTGSKQFLRELFEGRHGSYKNFFNDILEPLFYEALRIDRDHDDGYYSRFNCKIPFLNGGLFDPILNYDWVHTDIILPNELFSNDLKTKEGDAGNGILDIFDRYNFTVKEDEPLEKEVAVDPEMLGKVFENLLEVKDRKSKGTYYTPREIVHYMCRQSLINYLYTSLNDSTVSYEELGKQQAVMFKDMSKKPQMDLMIEHRATPLIPKEDIETLIKYGEQVGENEAAVEAKGKETERYFYRLPESIRQSAHLIDKKLADIKVCDPAIGSGAFPVGMMSEIVKTRLVLNSYLRHSREGGNPEYAKRTPYNFKRQCIEKSLYGVDIDPGAVEIAKLRLWLSLVVDEEDIKQIKPLPNLDYKIVCGNSLSSVNIMFHHQALLKLEDLKGRFFEETNPKKKAALKEEIDNLISEITHNDKHFDFKVYFSEVINHRGGFDVVIANPPYVRQEAIKDIKPELKKEFGDFYCGTADIYTYFYRRGLDVLRTSGHLCFIAPNKFMRAGYGKNNRNLLATVATPKLIIDFCELPVFEAGTDPAVILVAKGASAKDAMFTAAIIKTAEEIERVSDVVDDRGFKMKAGDLSVDGWTLESGNVLALVEKLRKVGKPLGEYVQGRFYRGITSGLNEAFVIDRSTRDKLLAEDPTSANVIKPWLRGRDIRKWKAQWADLYFLFIPWHFDIQKYPAVFKHLRKFKSQLEKRNVAEKDRYEWYALQRYAADYHQEFDRPKIIYADIAKHFRASYDTSGAFCANTLYILPTDDLSILGLLHCKLFDWYARYNFQVFGDALEGGRLRFIAQYMELVPFPIASDAQKAPIIKLVETILADPDSPDVPRLEAEIDQHVYALYGLAPEEIAIVEGKK